MRKNQWFKLESCTSYRMSRPRISPRYCTEEAKVTQAMTRTTAFWTICLATWVKAWINKPSKQAKKKKCKRLISRTKILKTQGRSLNQWSCSQASTGRPSNWTNYSSEARQWRRIAPSSSQTSPWSNSSWPQPMLRSSLGSTGTRTPRAMLYSLATPS